LKCANGLLFVPLHNSINAASQILSQLMKFHLCHRKNALCCRSKESLAQSKLFLHICNTVKWYIGN